jgi:methylenetetrahydrofolate dehydrogenase (NADP+)/methenyltetrahydrofolate cyclohydrolase
MQTIAGLRGSGEKAGVGSESTQYADVRGLVARDNDSGFIISVPLAYYQISNTMTAQLIDGVLLSQQLRADIGARAAALSARGRQPGLAVILVGEDPASAVYVRNKVKACADVGFHSVFEKYEADLSEAALLERIQALNADPAIHGILVQMPLPRHINPHKVIEAISTAKDVDGYSVLSAGELMTGLSGFRPCTPYGCMKLIESTGVALWQMVTVVIGRSNTVGKPMAMLLLQANATVTICHSATPDLAWHTRQADVVVAAVGRRNTLTAGMVKHGAVVIDVGMNRDENGKLCGDVDFAGVRELASHITPVPGGVGPMTITMLLMNTVEAAER